VSRWFRHYAGMMRDDKLVSASIRAKQPIERVVWIWGAILESAAEIDDDGRYEIDTAEMAWFLRADQCELDAVVSALVDIGRLAENRVERWGSRQFQSDRSAERQRRFRERQKEQDRAVDGEGETTSNLPPKASANGGVTSPSRHRDAPEADTETEELEPNGSCASDDALKPEHVVSVWNEQIAPALGKPKVRLLTPERRIRLNARIAGFTVAEFREVISNIMASPFLRGDTGWHGFSFDWFTKKANFLKILEGNYNG
jgi:hypothetical protein